MRFAKAAIVCALMVALGSGAVWALPYLAVIYYKVKGSAADCPWSKLLTLPGDAKRFGDIRNQIAPGFAVEVSDDPLGIELIRTPGRKFWIRKSGSDMGGRELLNYLFAEHQWMAESIPGLQVNRGDVVIDCGAHVGVFTDRALNAGASKVIQIEPDPINVECLRRNFRSEIESGRVILIPEGAWSSTSWISLNVGVLNSGMSSMVYKYDGGTSVQVQVRPIDVMLREKGIAHVDFIKMDIEGAEREALKGAAETLHRDRPRLMIDAYHLPDDSLVLPKVIRAAQPGYAMTCGPCELHVEHNKSIVPHVVLYR